MSTLDPVTNRPCVAWPIASVIQYFINNNSSEANVLGSGVELKWISVLIVTAKSVQYMFVE